MGIKIASLTLMLLGLFAGCQADRSKPVTVAALVPISGVYHHHEERFNQFWLKLRPDGTYNAGIDGCEGSYGSAKGDWTVVDRSVILSPSDKAAGLLNMPNHFDLITREDQSVLCEPASSDQRSQFPMLARAPTIQPSSSAVPSE